MTLGCSGHWVQAGRGSPGKEEGSVGEAPTAGTPLTWHVDHAAVAAPHHGLLLTLQAAGSNAVGIVARQGLLSLHTGPAVPPWLRQVGELPG